MNTDPIADMLTRIRNALQRRKPQVVIPHSRIKESVARIFADQRFICRLEVDGDGVGRHLVLTLTDSDRAASPITALQRISKPGRRVYVGWQTIPRIKNGRGLVIMSTNRGLLTGNQARKSRLGGEVICSIY